MTIKALLRRTCRTGSRVLALALVLAVPADAMAQPTPDKNAPPATAADGVEATYRQGHAAYDAGKFQEAYDLYKAAFAQSRSYEIAGSVAQAANELGKFAEAAEMITYSLSIFPTNGNPVRKAKMLELLADLKTKVATVQIGTNVAGAQVTIDAVAFGTTPLKGVVFVDAGEHRIRIEHDDYVAGEKVMTFAGGTTQDVSIDLAKKDGGKQTEPSGKAIWPAILLGGVAAVGIGAGIGLTVSAASQRSGVADDAGAEGCVNDSDPCAGAYQDTIDQANLFQDVGIAGLAIGGAAAVGMIVYLVIPEPKPATSGKVMRFIPQIAPGHAGASFIATF